MFLAFCGSIPVMQTRGDLKEVWRELKASLDKVYVYSLIHNDVTFYVGVGTQRRIRRHESAAELKKPNAKAVRFREILASGGVVEYAVHGWFDDWTTAAEEERRLIALHGRADLGLGTLTNRTNGGQGTSGVAWHSSPKRLEGARKAAEKNRGRKHSDEHRAKIGAAHKGRVYSAETLAKKSAAVKGRPLSEEHRKKLSEAKRGRSLPESAHAGRDRWFAEQRAAKKMTT